MTTDTLPALISVADAAAFLGISERAMRARLRRNDLRGRRDGRTWLIKRAELERFVDPDYRAAPMSGGEGSTDLLPSVPPTALSARPFANDRP